MLSQVVYYYDIFFLCNFFRFLGLITAHFFLCLDFFEPLAKSSHIL